MRGARPEYGEPSARTVDATDIGSQHPARYGQNDCEIALTRKNALFAGHDDGAENWAIVASLIEACKLNDVEPQAYLADVLVRLVNLWPNNRLDELLPWTWAAARQNSSAPPLESLSRFTPLTVNQAYAQRV